MSVALPIRQGSTFSFVFRWEDLPIVYRPITGVLNSAPVRITCPAHGLVDGWRAAVVSVRGMTQLNASVPPRVSQYRPVTVIGVDTIEFNDVNAADFSPYESGGYVQYYTPVDLTGYTARMRIRNKVRGAELTAPLTTESGQILLDPAARTITLLLSATTTAAFTFSRGVYDLEMVSPTEVVTSIAEGPVTVHKEITTDV